MKLKKPTAVTVKRVLIGIAVIIALLVVGDQIAPHIPAAEKWIQDQGVLAPVIYILLVCLLTLLCFPMDVLFVAAGMIFGLWWGTLYLTIATTVSQMIVFLVSRYLLRHRVENWLVDNQKMRILNRAIEHKGAQLLFLIRMAPIPASPVSYLMGVSSMRFGKFVLASTGLLPVAFASMYFGHAAIHAIDDANNPKASFGWDDALLYMGAFASIIGVAYIGHTARNAIIRAEKEEAALAET
ncbi:MAG: VTT domain-containing protein [Verrucomicrobiota bacterium]